VDFSFALIGKIQFSYCVPIPCMYRTVILLYWPHVSGFILCWPFGQYLYLFSVVVILFHFIMLADKFSNIQMYLLKVTANSAIQNGPCAI